MSEDYESFGTVYDRADRSAKRRAPPKQCLTCGNLVENDDTGLYRAVDKQKICKFELIRIGDPAYRITKPYGKLCPQFNTNEN